ncbi:AAA family ATPase [Streptomyces sp. NPDC059499]|uniref:AAA family ATPase n=1 Tax=Streptomyces sp. NPDC059499 TaxID=3346852 RepID=UPI003699B9E4
MAEIILPGFGVMAYRSFGDQMQFSGPLGSVTLLAGQNNSGKSNFLRLLAKVASGRHELEELDNHRGGGASCRYAVAIDWSKQIAPILEEKSWHSDVRTAMEKIFHHPAIERDGLSWISYELSGSLPLEQFDPVISTLGNSDILRTLQLMQHSSYSPGSEIQAGRQNLQTILRTVLPDRPWLSRGSVVTIEAFRQIKELSDTDAPEGTPEGLGLLPRLQRLQNPPASTHDRDTERFQAVNRFVKTILDDETARLEVQHDARTLNVHHGGRILPLENLGTGVHQVIILAVAATVNENAIVCVEEPEVHLHPIYQRKFIRYLASETNNQYLIATHSAHLLDHQSATVLHVRHNGQNSTLDPAVSPAELSGVCADLGYRPSDLLQTNAVIWVEGPSDRIYLNHWIRQARPGLIEGLHYSLMFYGGGLLNNLSAADEEVRDFIELRRLNRYMSIVIDSDKRSYQAKLNETKRRVQAEFDKDAEDGFVWVTDGYTIENYVPPDILREVVAEIHPKATQEWSGDKWQNPLILKNRSGAAQSPDKNRIARIVCERWADPPPANSKLAQMVMRCVSFIEVANRTSSNPVK